MRALVTCGPALAPIDSVRRITNMSTGALGVTLANALAAAGHEVVCFKGEAATTPLLLEAAVGVKTFATNDDLLERFRMAGSADAIFHAAALCDYEVARVFDDEGSLRVESKIPSRAGGLTIQLRPARKILPVLRESFPNAWIVGWKYELEGSRADAIAAGTRQMQAARTDLCVVNGAAYGEGFGLLHPGGRCVHLPDVAALCERLIHFLSANRKADEIPNRS